MRKYLTALMKEHVNFAHEKNVQVQNLGLDIFPGRQKKDQASKFKEVKNIMAILEIVINNSKCLLGK